MSAVRATAAVTKAIVTLVLLIVAIVLSLDSGEVKKF
jgi:hypothetical protein